MNDIVQGYFALVKKIIGLEKGRGLESFVMMRMIGIAYLELVYLVTALVPSLTACLANSPGKRRRTDVCTSRLEMVERPLWLASLDASFAILSKMSFTNEFMMLIALLEMPVSGCTCFKTL